MLERRAWLGSDHMISKKHRPIGRARRIAACAPPPWSALRLARKRTIEAYFEQARAWQPIVTCTASPHGDARATADLIIGALQYQQHSRILIPEAVAALELCLKCNGISWAAEHDAQIVLARAKTLGWWRNTSE